MKCAQGTLARRDLIAGTVFAAMGASLGTACGRNRGRNTQSSSTGQSPSPSSSLSSALSPPPSGLDAATSWTPFPLIEARGSEFEVGAEIGARSKDSIRTCIERRRTWFEDLKRFALADRGVRLDGFLDSIDKHHPAIGAEIRGLAKGADLPLDDVLILNLQPELAALKEQSTCGDCSSLLLVAGGRLLLAHNEDDDDAYRDQMLLVRVRPSGAPAFVSLAYPGVIAGNVPTLTEAGLVRTTNYIGAKNVRVGIPRYVLGRAILSCRSVDEVLTVATHPEGAYSFNINLGSIREKRLVSLEIAPGGVHEMHEVKNELYVHTNHFIRRATRDIPQQASYVGGSSDSRYQVLTRAAAKLGDPSRIVEDDLIRLLASHDAVTRPYSPCRHPEGKIKGRTEAMAVFDIAAGTFALYEGNPCENRRRLVSIG